MMLVPTVPTAYIEWRNYVDEAQKTLEQATLSLSSGSTRKHYADLLLKNFANRDASFAILEDELREVAALKEGWDSYDAPAPAPESVECAKQVLEKLRIEQLLPDTVAPSAEGGVSIYFSQGKQKAFIEFLNEGEILLARYNKDDEPHVEVLRGLQDLSNQALQGIRDHLGARA
jgi:hypothetical protein